MPKRGENIRKRKDGRWEGRFKSGTSPSGATKYISIYGKSYSEVKEKLKAITQYEAATELHKFKDRQFKEVLLLWKETNRLNHKRATQTKYDYLIEKHIIPALGSYKLTDITNLLLNKFVEQKLQSGRLDKKGGLSPAYVRTMMLIISSTLDFAAKEQMCLPLKSAVYKPSPEKKELPILTVNEQKHLEWFLNNDLDQTKLGVLISLHTGLRIGEICALTWEDVDLETQIIHVRSTVARIKNDNIADFATVLVIDKPKTKSSIRDIPISTFLYPILLKMKDQSNSKYVISDTPGFVSPRTYEYRYHKILNDCNIQPINFHALRHTFATRCVEAGIDVKTLSEILGHANVSVTLNTYVHSSMELKRNQLEKLPAMFA